MTRASEPQPFGRARVHDRIEAVAAAIEAGYVLPDAARSIAATIRARLAAGAYDDAPDRAELCRRVTRDLQQQSRDLHLRLEPVTEADGPARPAARMRAGGYGIARLERLPGNLGLLELRYLAPAELGGDAMLAALRLLAERDALIVDLRRARGGDPGMIALISTALFDAEAGPQHLNDIHTRDGSVHQWWTLPWLPGPRLGSQAPVCVLTSAATFSGAEEFAWNLRALGRATIIGERTAGGAHPTREVELDDLLLQLPHGRSINPHSGDNWEGRGIRPDIEQPAAEAEAAARAWLLDRLIDRAAARGAGDEVDRLRRHRQAIGAPMTPLGAGAGG